MKVRYRHDIKSNIYYDISAKLIKTGVVAIGVTWRKKDFQTWLVCWGQKETVRSIAPCIMFPPHRPSSASLWSTENMRKAILCLAYDWSLRAERYVSPKEHFVLWNLIAAIADRKWERLFHFPVAIFAHKLNKGPFATEPRLHPPTVHAAGGRR